MLLKTQFNKDPILYEIFIKTYQDLYQGKISLNGQVKLEESVVELSKEIGFAYFRKIVSVMRYGRKIFLKPPSKKVHNSLMSYKPETEKAIRKQREEFFIKKIYVVVKEICKKYPNLATEILDSFENNLLENLEILHQQTCSRRLHMLKLTAIRRVRKEVVK